MSDTTQNEAFVVNRTLQVPDLATNQDADFLIGSLEGVDGVMNVTMDPGTHKLRVTYDETRITFTAIENLLTERGYPLSNSRWSRLKRAYYRFTDENVQDSAAKPSGACCSHPRGIYGKHDK